MKMKWRVKVDRKTCIGASACTAVAPTNFLLDENYRSVPTEELIEPDAAVVEAASGCPVDAITITEEGSGRTIYP